MNKLELDKSLICILNILTLVKKEPKTWLPLWNTGCFYNPRKLTKSLRICAKTGLIDAQDAGIYLFCINGKGIRLLADYFPWWEPKVVRSNVHTIEGYEVRKQIEEAALNGRYEGIVIPLGRRLKPSELRVLKHVKRRV